MKFCIITHIVHSKKGDLYFGYGPYVREMNIWLKYVDEVLVVAPLGTQLPTAIDSAYAHHKIHFEAVPAVCFSNMGDRIKSLFLLPLLCWKVFWAMKEADHIHLRCPGNMGLIGCFIQMLFPHKPKTAKYAGNWDPESKQPWSYRLQKRILANRFFCRNIKVLVYGEWENQARHIIPFFTATYATSEMENLRDLKLTDPLIRMLFVGGLSVGKNPLYAVQLVQALRSKGFKVVLELFGEGNLRAELENYSAKHQLEDFVFMHGNQQAAVIKKAYQNSHFVVLPSKSEGWPKAIAEGMFWACVPLATRVSCLANMLGQGERGLLLHMDLEKDLAQIELLLRDERDYENKRKAAAIWSRSYTLDRFEAAIKNILQNAE